MHTGADNARVMTLYTQKSLYKGLTPQKKPSKVLAINQSQKMTIFG